MRRCTERVEEVDQTERRSAVVADGGSFLPSAKGERVLEGKRQVIVDTG